MKTTHQLARELLDMPDVPVIVAYWLTMADHEPTVKMTDYRIPDQDEVAIIVQERVFSNTCPS